MPETKCKFCELPIRWVNENGRFLALDPTPASGGAYRIIGAETATRIPTKDLAVAGGPRYRPHKETCPKWEDIKTLLSERRRRGSDDGTARLPFKERGDR